MLRLCKLLLLQLAFGSRSQPNSAHSESWRFGKRLSRRLASAVLISPETQRRVQRDAWHDGRRDDGRDDVGNGALGLVGLLAVILLGAALIKYVFFRW